LYRILAYVSYVLHKYYYIRLTKDRLCGLVVRVLGYRFGGPGFDSPELKYFPKKKKKKKENK
jgi:hypothetical protein